MANILLIDDEPLVRQTLSQILQVAGHSTTLAGDGNEGLRLFELGRFDLVITDIIMPDREGIDTIMALRRLAPNVPIVAISGGGRTGNTDFLRVAASLGATATLRKPFDMNELLQLVDKLSKPGRAPPNGTPHATAG